RLAVALAPPDATDKRVADEALLLFLRAVLDERRHEHARALAHDLVRGARTPELLGDDRRLERVGRLLGAAVAARNVAVEVAALDRLQPERGRAIVDDDAARHRGGTIRIRLAGRVLRG